MEGWGGWRAAADPELRNTSSVASCWFMLGGCWGAFLGVKQGSMLHHLPHVPIPSSVRLAAGTLPRHQHSHLLRQPIICSVSFDLPLSSYLVWEVLLHQRLNCLWLATVSSPLCNNHVTFLAVLTEAGSHLAPPPAATSCVGSAGAAAAAGR